MNADVLWREDFECPSGVGGAIVFVAIFDDAAISLTPTERDLAEAPRREPSRTSFLKRRAFARRALAARLCIPPREVTIGHAPSGAPQIVAPKTDLRVSLAGRENFCAVGLASSPIGVDIEPVSRVIASAWNILHRREQQDLARLDESARHEKFLRIWTAKEAYLKALGLGLRREPSDVEIIATSSEGFVLRDLGRETPLGAAQWRRIALSGAEFIAACVVLDSNGGV
jgi:4'-phosphopantetheinyl transferase